MGSKLLFYLVILPISRLPYFLLYGFSNFVCFIMYNIIGYRKKIIVSNIKNSFPNKTDAEVKTITKKFYKHFVDLIFESLKNFTVSEKNAIERMVFRNPEIVNQYYQQGRSVVLCGGHYGNWEMWGVAAAGQMDHPLYGIYKKLSNAFFDNKMIETRGRFGLYLLPTREVNQRLEEMKHEVIASVYGFDQSPGDPKKAYWINFLNQDTPCSYGVEKYAIKYNSPVIYVHLIQIKRGFYEAEYELLFDDPSKTEYGEIIKKVNGVLEKDIIKTPHLWLWSHRRWKHKRK